MCLCYKIRLFSKVLYLRIFFSQNTLRNVSYFCYQKVTFDTITEKRMKFPVSRKLNFCDIYLFEQMWIIHFEKCSGIKSTFQPSTIENKNYQTLQRTFTLNKQKVV